MQQPMLLESRVTIIFGLLALILSPTIGQKGAPGMELEIMDFDLALGEKLNADYWQQRSIETLRTKISHLNNAGFPTINKNRRAKNIILFVGDGMGVSGITATRKFKESISHKPFYENELVWDSFPFSGFSKTYELDNVIADSAGTATAYLAGVKTRMGFIGVDGRADLTCSSTKGRIESIAKWAHRAGKASGLVTTTTITHASPSPLYAHLPAPLRPYEYSADKFQFSKTHPNCEDIAKQFVKYGQHLKVALGGGRAYFTPNTEIPEGDVKRGVRNDGVNLVEEWKRDRSKNGRRAAYMTSRDELLNLDPKSMDYLLGLFHYDHMTFMDDNPPQQEPTLTDMTAAAIKVLSENKDGFFLFVEGGRIDHGHHNGVARYALTEGIEFDRAIKTALEMTDASETLIIVTADHSHTLSMGGYLPHNSSILGQSVNLGFDKKTYTSLLYANGPGANYTFSGSRPNDSASDVLARGYRQQAIVPLRMEGHGGEDVPVYANGIYSEFFSGVMEQSFIPWAMACAAGIHYGPGGEIVQEMVDLCPRPLLTVGDGNHAIGIISAASCIKLQTLVGVVITMLIGFFRN